MSHSDENLTHPATRSNRCTRARSIESIRFNLIHRLSRCFFINLLAQVVVFVKLLLSVCRDTVSICSIESAEKSIFFNVFNVDSSSIAGAYSS